MRIRVSYDLYASKDMYLAERSMGSKPDAECTCDIAPADIMECAWKCILEAEGIRDSDTCNIDPETFKENDGRPADAVGAASVTDERDVTRHNA